MEKPWNAEEFYEQFTAVLKNNEKDVKHDYHDSTKWTTRIKEITESVFGNNNISREYYRIDTLKYEYTNYYNNFNNNHKKEFNEKGVYLNVYNWKNIYTIEYENDCHSWTDELVKLSHIRSELKVIICYSEWLGSKENYERIIAEKMIFAKELLKNCQEQSLNDNWLIIFGPCHGGKKKYDKDLLNLFVGYKSDSGEFKKI